MASTKETKEHEEFMVPPSTWAVFYEEGPVIKMQELETRIGEHSDILSDLPENMKADIIKSGECKKLNGLKCAPTEPL